MDIFSDLDNQVFEAESQEIKFKIDVSHHPSPLEASLLFDDSFSEGFRLIPTVNPFANNKSSRLHELTLPKILDDFFNGSKQHPRKEEINAFLVRKVKRAIKCARNGETPKKICNKIDINSEEEMELWNMIKGLYRKERHQAEKILKINPSRLNSKGCKSFTWKFCKGFYDHPIARDIFYILLEMFYAKEKPKDLCEKFKLRCCEGIHSSACEESWRSLKEYLRSCYLSEIDLSCKNDIEVNEFLDLRPE